MAIGVPTSRLMRSASCRFAGGEAVGDGSQRRHPVGNRARGPSRKRRPGGGDCLFDLSGCASGHAAHGLFGAAVDDRDIAARLGCRPAPTDIELFADLHGNLPARPCGAQVKLPENTASYDRCGPNKAPCKYLQDDFVNQWASCRTREASVHIGLTLPQLGGHVTRDGLRGFCEQAEELGYGSLWVQEHLFYPHHPVSGYSARPGLAVPEAYRSVLSALETLTAAAAWTTQPVIGTSILVAGLHRPVGLGPAAGHHRSTFRGPARRGLQRRLVGRGAPGHGRGPPHPGCAV